MAHSIWHEISPKRISPSDFIACIEIPTGCKNKYEMDKDTGMLILDRVLYTSTHYPANYGFIPRTYASDNDPLDVLVLCQETIMPMTLVRCYPIGVIKMVDDNQVDEKIIAVPFKDPSLSYCTDISQLPAHTFDEISHFFRVYKSLEGKDTVVNEVLGREAAMDIIAKCMQQYKDTFC